MKYLLFLILAVCTFAFSTVGTNVSVQEFKWEELSTCEACAKCGEAISDKKERAKTFTFYDQEKVIGEWYLIEAQLLSCNELQYRTLSPNGRAVRGDVFDNVDDALLDIAQEVRKAVPSITTLEEKTSGGGMFTEFLLENWQMEVKLPEDGRNSRQY